MFSLEDDGTLDTVITCNKCGRSRSYIFGGEHVNDCNQIASGDCDCYGRFVDWAIYDTEQQHDCLPHMREARY